MAMTKHVGRLISPGKKVAVIFRNIHDDEGNITDRTHALAVDTDALPNMWVDSFMDAVLSDEGQDTIDFYEVCMRKTLPDGRFILPALVQERRMRKIRTNEIMMEPDKQVRILLSDLNENDPVKSKVRSINEGPISGNTYYWENVDCKKYNNCNE